MAGSPIERGTTNRPEVLRLRRGVPQPIAPNLNPEHTKQLIDLGRIHDTDVGEILDIIDFVNDESELRGEIRFIEVYTAFGDSVLPVTYFDGLQKPYTVEIEMYGFTPEQARDGESRDYVSLLLEGEEFRAQLGFDNNPYKQTGRHAAYLDGWINPKDGELTQLAFPRDALYRLSILIPDGG